MGKNKTAESITKLLEIVRALRDPQDGCPWDKEQTHESLRPYVIEEAYEVVAAINDAPETLKDELGDLLLQVLLHAEIASEEKRFSLTDISDNLREKLIRRHPHVFGDETANNPEEVKKHWERVKKEEKGDKKEGLLDSLPKNFPALYESYKIGKKVSKVNFDWDSAKEVREKITEELAEVDEVLRSTPQNVAHLEEELGDLLFTVAQLARKLGIEPETALKRANQKFKKRFSTMESLSEVELGAMSKEELEKLWARAKVQE